MTTDWRRSVRKPVIHPYQISPCPKLASTSSQHQHQISNPKLPKVKSSAYKTLVRPKLEYSQTFWDPHTKDLTSQLERVQRQAARFCLHRYRQTSSVGEMITQLDWPLLEERRRQARLSMFQRIHRGLVATKMPLVLKSQRQRVGHENLFAYSTSTSSYVSQSFFLKTARDWNSLPTCIATLPTSDSFKAALLRLQL